jgi:Uma2 family endonuclease
MNGRYKSEELMSLEEFEAFIKLTENEDKRFELIDGNVYAMSSPSSTHADIVGYLHGTIFNFLKGKPCKAYMNLDVRLKLNDSIDNNKRNANANDKDNDVNVFIPDLFVNCNPNRIKTNYCLGAPGFIVEVVSPSTMNRDYYLKYYQYLMNGVQEYWVINHTKNRITVHTPEFIKEYTFNDKVPIKIFNGELVIDFGDLSETLKN